MFRNLYIKAVILLTAILAITLLYNGLSHNNGASVSLPKSTMQPVEKPGAYVHTAPATKEPDQFRTFMGKIESLQSLGELNKANQLINDYLINNKSNLTQDNINQLNFELERNNRIVSDYKLSESSLFNTLTGLIGNFSKKEFQQWQNEGRFDILNLNGQKRFAASSKSNLFFRYPELRKRRIDYKKDDPFARSVLAHIRKIKASSPGKDGVVRLSRKAQVYQSLTLNKGAVPAGKDLRCWLPYPVASGTQDNIKLISSSPAVKSIDRENSKTRSVYFETKSKGNQAVKFDVKYSYTSYSYYRKIDTHKVTHPDVNSPIYIEYTKEEPHVVFSTKMINQAKSITGSEENPYLKARKIYDWICDNIKYSYSVEYSTIRNISEYTLNRKYGDCGQESLLFITLCRISGIPARWQSGFLTFPNKQIPHDWAEIYIEPYGWIPADPYMGTYFTSVTDDLTKNERKEIRDFYFGNIDNYRMVANTGHSQALSPAKNHFRSDNVDFQRGEIETADKNLYFNQWTYSFKSQ
jgi:hypothetical protein